MSSHRAVRRHDRTATPESTSQPQTPGRRRASRAPRRGGSGGSVSPSSMIGGLALLVAAVGAVTAGQAMSAGDDPAPTASRQDGAYVARASTTALEGRNATRVSRSTVRPKLDQDPSLENAAEETADARSDELRDAADEAEEYVEELENNEWVLPLQGFRISTWFGEAGGYWSSGYHTGVDLAAGYGTPVVAVSNGTITKTGWDGAYGNQIRVRLENGDEVWYNHLSAIEVTAGQTVVKGAQLGRVGDTGNSYGYHLHFEYRLASDLKHGVDPVPYFTEHGIILS